MHDGTTRDYRADRMLDAQESGAAALRPGRFDLTTFWEDWEAEYAAKLPVYSARVRLGPLALRHRDDLGPLSPRSVSERPAEDEGWIEQTLLFDDRRVAVAALLALSPEVEIITPVDLRDDLVATAMQVIDRRRTAHSA